jgi:hypothetical protein
MKKILFYLLLFLFSPSVCLVASTSYYFYVQLKDKNNSPYSLSKPSEFLSQRAIDRRASFYLICDSTDLPVNPSYISQISNLGIKIHSRTKWLNGLTILVSRLLDNESGS